MQFLNPALLFGMAGRRRRAAAEQRRIEQQRWGQYLDDDDDGDISLVTPTPANTRRRARRSSRRNSARDDLEDYLNGTVDEEFEPSRPLRDELDVELDVALGNPHCTPKIGRGWNAW